MRVLLPVGRKQAQKRALSGLRPLGVACVCLLTVSAGAAKHEKAAPPTPSVRIDTVPLDYHPLSSFYLLSRSSSSSLDFIDKEHLLFTFRATGLMKRLPECQPDDQDQLIRALVIHLPDGKIERSAEWRMHDRGRYLWSLGNGKFMVRQRDTLSFTDASLELHPFLHSNTPLRLVKLAPDAQSVLVETDLEKHTVDEHRQMTISAQADGLLGPSEDVLMTVLRLSDRSVLLRARALSVSDVPIISDGYIETIEAQGDQWMLRYRPFKGEPTVIGKVESSCRPNEDPLNDRTTVVTVCPNRSADHILQAISLQGKMLWTYRWDSHYIWPTTAASQSGRRIAFSTLRVARPVNMYDPFDETEVQGQRVDVLDADTGALELTQYATPALSAGQNYALSPEGDRFAVLRDNAIEIYNLPPDAPQSADAGKPPVTEAPDLGGAN
jgi:hypothetical protein